MKSFSTFETKDDSTQKTHLDEIVIFLKIKVNLEIQCKITVKISIQILMEKSNIVSIKSTQRFVGHSKESIFPHDSIEGDSGWL